MAACMGWHRGAAVQQEPRASKKGEKCAQATGQEKTPMKQCRGHYIGVAFGPAAAAGGTAANMYVLGGKASNIGKNM